MYKAKGLARIKVPSFTAPEAPTGSAYSSPEPDMTTTPTSPNAGMDAGEPEAERSTGVATGVAGGAGKPRRPRGLGRLSGMKG